MAEKMSFAEIGTALNDVKEWDGTDDGAAITRTYTFADFQEAFAFMTRVARIAEDMDHHPDWTNVYNRVEVKLSTHDVGGVTGKDFRLASAMDKAAKATD